MEYSRDGDTTENNIADAHFTLDNKGHEHTLRLCNIYCFLLQQWLQVGFTVLLYTYIASLAGEKLNCS
jgi:hypothetical protein